MKILLYTLRLYAKGTNYNKVLFSHIFCKLPNMYTILSLNFNFTSEFVQGMVGCKQLVAAEGCCPVSAQGDHLCSGADTVWSNFFSLHTFKSKCKSV